MKNLKFYSVRKSVTIKQIARKTFLLLTLILLILIVSKGQVRVDANGNSTVLGDLFIDCSANYQTLLFEEGPDGSCGLFTTGNNAGQIGSSSRQFYKVYSRYIYANQYPVTSDKRLKENFREIESPLAKILMVKGLKYDFKDDETDSIKNKQKELEIKANNKDRLGVIAQDLQKVIPEAVVYDKENDKYYIDYNSITPVLIEALKELSAEVDELKNKSSLKSALLGNENISEQATEASLAQNIPNPFSISTRIDIYLPETVSNAKLYIYNMQGTQIQNYTLSERGETSVVIDGYSLDAGMYLYTLIANGKEVDTKKMILTN